MEIIRVITLGDYIFLEDEEKRDDIDVNTIKFSIIEEEFKTRGTSDLSVWKDKKDELDKVVLAYSLCQHRDIDDVDVVFLEESDLQSFNVKQRNANSNYNDKNDKHFNIESLTYKQHKDFVNLIYKKINEGKYTTFLQTDLVILAKKLLEDDKIKRKGLHGDIKSQLGLK